MIKQPLFGQDSSPHKTSTFLSAVITFVLWLFMTIAGVFIKIKPAAPKYKEVQIVLSSQKLDTEREQSNEQSASAAAPMEAMPETVESTPEFVEAPAPVVETKPAAKTETKPVTTKTETAKPKTQTAKPKTQTTPKKTETPKTTDPAKKVNFDDYQYATDYSDFDFNNVSTNKKATWDDSMFDTPSEPEPQISKKVEKVTIQSTIEGSAASTTTQKTQTQTSSQNKTNTSNTQTASSATTSALSNIKNTQYSVSTGNSLKAITDAKTSKSSDGKLNMEMSDGSTRVLIEPIPPTIKLSNEAAALIDSTRTVTIEFRVLASGNVPRADIKITPESILPQIVRNEIYDQLSSWLFESSSSSARATFEYTIKKQ